MRKRRFGSDQIVHALDEGAIKRFLASQAPEDWSKAVRLLRACTVVLWEGAERRGKEEKEPRLRVDEYWLREMLKHQAADYGKKAGREASTVLRDRVQEVFAQGGRASWRKNGTSSATAPLRKADFSWSLISPT